MLFRNLRSGGIVSATNEDSIALMQRSPIYEEYIPPTPEKKRTPLMMGAQPTPVRTAKEGLIWHTQTSPSTARSSTVMC